MIKFPTYGAYIRVKTKSYAPPTIAREGVVGHNIDRCIINSEYLSLQFKGYFFVA